MLGGSLLGAEPLNALQLLWVNLLTDTLPALALALAPGRPPRAGAPAGGSGQRAARRPALAAGGPGRVAPRRPRRPRVSGRRPAAAFATLPAAQLGYAAGLSGAHLAQPLRTPAGAFHSSPWWPARSRCTRRRCCWFRRCARRLRIPSLTPAVRARLVRRGSALDSQQGARDEIPFPIFRHRLRRRDRVGGSGPSIAARCARLGTAGYRVLDAIAVSAARRREDLADLLAEARARASGGQPSGRWH